MRDRLEEQIVEGGMIVGAGNGIVQIEQRFGFLAADRRARHTPGRDQNACEQGCIVRADHASRMCASGDHGAIARDHRNPHLLDGKGGQRRMNLLRHFDNAHHRRKAGRRRRLSPGVKASISHAAVGSSTAPAGSCRRTT